MNSYLVYVLFHSGLLSHNVDDSCSTPNVTSTNRISDNEILPQCGESFHDKSPPVLQNNSLWQNCNNNGQPQRKSMVQDKGKDHLLKNFTLQQANVDPNSANSTPALQTQELDNIIDIKKVDVQSPCSEHTPSTSVVPNAFSQTALKKSKNSLPDDGYRSKQYMMIPFYTTKQQ